jgi:hypothetical protein
VTTAATPPGARREILCGLHTTASEFATESSHRTSLRPPARNQRLNGLRMLTGAQVLAVDLLNPSPAAYAYPPSICRRDRRLTDIQ